MRGGRDGDGVRVVAEMKVDGVEKFCGWAKVMREGGSGRMGRYG